MSQVTYAGLKSWKKRLKTMGYEALRSRATLVGRNSASSLL